MPGPPIGHRTDFFSGGFYGTSKTARIKPGDQLEVGYSGGLIVMRKRRALTPARVRSLLLGGRDLPELTGQDETAVAAAVQRTRRRVKA